MKDIYLIFTLRVFTVELLLTAYQMWSSFHLHYQIFSIVRHFILFYIDKNSSIDIIIIPKQSFLCSVSSFYKECWRLKGVNLLEYYRERIDTILYLLWSGFHSPLFGLYTREVHSMCIAIYTHCCYQEIRHWIN